MISFSSFARFWAVINLMSASYQFFNPRVRALDWVELPLILLVLFRPQRVLWIAAAFVSILIFISFRLPYVSMSECTIFLLNIHWLLNNAFSRDQEFRPGAYYLIPGSIFIISGIHKLNDSFFDQAHSCVTMFYPWISASFIPWALIPALVLLLYFIVGIGQFTKFKKQSWLVMFALQAPLCFFGVWEFTIATWSGVISSSMKDLTPKRMIWMGSWLSVYLIAVLALRGDLRIYLASICTLGLLTPFLLDTQKVSSDIKPKWPEYSLVASLVVWCLSPYWGGNQHNVFSMFSNLQLSPFFSNSWLPNKGKEISPDEWVELKEAPVLKEQVYLPVATRVDLEQWDRKGSLYLPVRYLYFLLKEGVQFSFYHKGQKWDWPGNASEWRAKGYMKDPERRKAVSNGHCQS